MDFLNISIEKWVQDEDRYRKQLQDVWDAVPVITADAIHRFKDENLVRFRGMVQDMHGPEYYVPKFSVVNTKTHETSVKFGKYRDVTRCANNETISVDETVVPDERHNYVVVSVPATNPWVYQCENLKIHQEREVTTPSTSNLAQKRPRDEDMDTDCENVKKTTRVSEETNKQPLLSREYLLNHPIVDENVLVCQLRVYNDLEALSLNDVCEFVGFLSFNAPKCDEDDENMETQVHHPPTSLVPRIHAVHFKKLTHHNPLVKTVSFETFHNVKQEFLILLTQLLAGDTLAAEYLICHLLSSVYMRKDFLPLGKFALNISNTPRFDDVDFVRELYGFLELFLTKSHYFPISLENMNSVSFTPKKDYDTNRLNTGILQLSDNTLLLLDETKLEEGKLDAGGVAAVKSLAHAIKTQKVSYDFNYYPLEYNCDLQFLIMSEGKSMLPSDVHVPLRPDNSCLNTYSEILQAAKHFLKPNLLDQIRVYLTKARMQAYQISDATQELIQRQFADMRQQSNMTVDDLHSLLVLGRLVSLSEGKTVLDEACWKKACDMELERKSRL